MALTDQEQQTLKEKTEVLNGDRGDAGKTKRAVRLFEFTELQGIVSRLRVASGSGDLTEIKAAIKQLQTDLQALKNKVDREYSDLNDGIININKELEDILDTMVTTDTYKHLVDQVNNQQSLISNALSSEDLETAAFAMINNAIANGATVVRERKAMADRAADITKLSQVIVDEKSATASELLQLTSKTDATNAYAGRLTQTFSDYSQATSIDVTELKAKTDVTNSNLQTLNSAYANFEQATTTSLTMLGSQVGSNSANVSTLSQTVATMDGKLSAQLSFKVGVTQDGKYYGAGIGIGVENAPIGMQSNILMLADRFGFLSSVAGGAPQMLMAIDGPTGNVIINSARIGNATINFAKIADDMRSTSFVTGSNGWNLPKNGNAEFNNGVFRGGVFASYGKFTGTVEANDGYFRGKIESNDGYFKGDVYAERLQGDVSKTYAIAANSVLTISAQPFTRTLAIPIIASWASSTSTQTSNSANSVITLHVNGALKYNWTTQSSNGSATAYRATSHLQTIPAGQTTTVDYRASANGSGASNSGYLSTIIVIASKA